jgi:hypothetical protein
MRRRPGAMQWGARALAVSTSTLTQFTPRREGQHGAHGLLHPHLGAASSGSVGARPGARTDARNAERRTAPAEPRTTLIIPSGSGTPGFHYSAFTEPPQGRY